MRTDSPGLHQRLWKELHQAKNPNEALLKRIYKALPCDVCALLFAQYINRNPPNFELNWFEWTVNLHNYVNQELKKPILTLGEARAIWL